MIHLEKRNSSHSIGEREEFLRKVSGGLNGHHVLLNTCDRVEIYIDDLTARYSADELYETVYHLYRVAAGLESPIPGENQILHQVKKAYLGAVAAGRATKNLHMLFQSALHAGKLARSATGIGHGAMSHGQAAVEILSQRFTSLHDKSITLIGVNNLNKNILRYLKKTSAAMIFLGNRTFEKAVSLAEEFSCEAFPLSERKDVLMQTDILISATSAPHIIINADDIPENKELFVIDLAVPRDIDPRIALYPAVTLMNVADVENTIRSNIQYRADQCAAADGIIRIEAGKFISKHMSCIKRINYASAEHTLRFAEYAR